MIGLGAQSSKIFSTPQKLVSLGVRPNKIKVEFFEKLSERTNTFGIRGEFTAECLDLMGIHNYRIIGCPSMFMNLDGTFPQIADPERGKYQITITPGSSHIKTKLLELGMKEYCYWVKQCWSEIPTFSTIGGKKILNVKWRLKEFPGLLCSTDKILEYNNKYSKIFFDLDEWFKMYSQEKISFAFGTRFHGNMVAMQNGIPTLWVIHDSRTRELTDFLHLPSVPLEMIGKIKHIEELFEYCNYDETVKHYRALCDNYIEFLEENEIKHLYSIN